MNPLALHLSVFACGFCGAVIGMLLRSALPEHHLSSESRNSVNLGIGLVATMAALVLGLVVSSAAGSYFAQRDELNQMSARLVLLDRILAHYGPEANVARQTLRDGVAEMIDRMWPEEHRHGTPLAPKLERGDAIYEEIQQLSPHDDAQRALKGNALNVAG